MLYRKITGIIIICLNLGGICVLLYMAALKLKNSLFSRQASAVPDLTGQKSDSSRKQPVNVNNDDIVPDEDDLLKDMDLSAFDDLDLDDFD
jgi:hypothetical protein